MQVDPYHLWLGILPHQRPTDHYRLLGIERLELNSDVIVNAAERQLDHLKRFSSGDNHEIASSLADDVTRARDCLLDHPSHRLYAAELQGVDSQPADLASQADWRAFTAEFDQAWRAAQGLGFDPQHHWLGIPLQQRPASNARLLGLSDRENDADVIRCAAERQISFVRKFATGEQSDAANDLLRQLSRARAALLRSIKPDIQQHAEVQGHPQASAPVSPEPAHDRTPSVVEPDLADLDASDWDVPAPMMPPPPPSPPVVSGERDGREMWIAGAIAAALTGLTVLLVAGFIAYSRWNAHPATPVAETDLLEAALDEDKADDEQADEDRASRFSATVQQAERADPAMTDLDSLTPAESVAETDRDRADASEQARRYEDLEHVLEHHQTVAALQQLAAFRNQMHEVQARIDKKVTTDEDHQEVFDLIEKLGKLGAQYPQRRSTVDKQAETLRLNAMMMLQEMQRLRQNLAIAERESKRSAEQESMTLAESESMSREAEVPEVQFQPLDSRSLFSRSRSWKTKQGASFDASVVKVDESQVTFKSLDTGREATMPIEELIPEDVAVLRLASFGDQDRQQLERTRTFISRIASAPTESVDTLTRTHLASRDSPYAGLWAAVCMTMGENRHAEAGLVLRQVISRIEQQRQFDSSRHGMTLASALNNLAVCMIKDHKADAAAGLFVRSLDTMPSPSTVVLHNSRQLKEFAQQPATPLALTSLSRRKLDQALQQHSENQDSLPSGWYYSLDVDLPRFEIADNTSGERYLSQNLGAAGGASSLRVRDTWCITCKGLGSMLCKYGNCIKGTVVVQQRVQVAVNPITGEPVYGNKGFKQSCPNCSGRGRFDCPHCQSGRL